MKKIIPIALAVLFAQQSRAQNSGFSLTVELPGAGKTDKAYLVTNYGWSNNKVLDSAELKNGAFRFKGNFAEPVKASLLVNHNQGKDGPKWNKNNDVLIVYLENANIKVNGKDSVTGASVSGSKINTEYSAYSASVLSVAVGASKVANVRYAKASDEEKKDKGFQAGLMADLKKELKVMDSLKYVYIAQHPDSYLSLEALVELAGSNPDVTRIAPLFKGLSPALHATKKGKAFAELLYDTGPLGIGAMAPNFTQNDVNDKPVSLSDLKGKYVLLDFWASWCGPCRGENPNVVKAYEKYKDKSFTVLGVSLDQPGKKEAWLAAIKADGLPWTQVSDLQFWNNAAAKIYNIRSIPQNFLIDPNGKIVAKNLRGEALSHKLAQLLK